VVACPSSTVVKTDILCSSCLCTAIVAVHFVGHLASRLVDRLVDRLALVAVDAAVTATVAVTATGAVTATVALVYKAVV
jgi:hypothetical protein